jgi:hypothetical protein
MSNIAIQGAATGTGVFTLASPATNTNRTLTLPDEAGTVLTDRVIGVNASAPDDSVVVDASGNLLVKKTSSASNTVGIELGANGAGWFTGDGIRPLLVNRKTSDGDIVEFRKDGVNVGSIGAKSGDIYIGTGDTGIRFNDGDNAVYAADTTTGGASDGNISLGVSAARFKDLYLSGGVYVGGTGSANKLDDYEEGTWTPTIDIEGGGTVSGTGKYGFYTKVGRVVTVHFGMFVTSTSGAGSGNALNFSNLPFITKDGVAYGYPAVCRVNVTPLAVNGWYGRAFSNATNGRIEALGTSGTGLINSSNYIGNNTRMDFTITYVTDV